MGEIELQLKMIREALSHFKQASEEDPDNEDLQVKIGDTLLTNGLPQESEEYYEKALDMNPELAHVYNRLGIAYRKQKKFGMAISLYEKALQFHPEDEHLALQPGPQPLGKSNSFQKPVSGWKKSLKINPQFKDAKRFLNGIKKQMEQAAQIAALTQTGGAIELSEVVMDNGTLNLSGAKPENEDS